MSLSQQHGMQRLINEFHAKFYYNVGNASFDIFAQSRLVTSIEYDGTGEYRVILARSTYNLVPPRALEVGEYYKTPIYHITTEEEAIVRSYTAEVSGRCVIYIYLKGITYSGENPLANAADGITVHLTGGWPALSECRVTAQPE